MIIHAAAGDDVLVYRRASQHLEQVLTAGPSLRVEFFHEYLQDLKLPVDSIQLAESLEKKYFSAGTPDLIVAIGTTALKLCVNYGRSHFRAVPVVFLLANTTAVPMPHLPPQMTGVDAQFDVAGTVALALHLHLAARHISFVVGTSTLERDYEDIFKKETEPPFVKVRPNLFG